MCEAEFSLPVGLAELQQSRRVLGFVGMSGEQV